MEQYVNLLARLTAPHVKDVIERLKNYKPEPGSSPRRLFIKTGIRPVDLYCYFQARFGPPNGLQSFLRQNDSSNIFHWHYSLWADGRPIEIMAGTYKIEVWFPEQFCYSEHPIEDFVSAIVDDLRNHGAALKAIRSTLEKWLLFINPFYRLHLALEGMLGRAGDLLKTTKHPPKHPETKEESDVFAKEFQPIANASYEAFALCRSVRMLIPVLAETFVNFLLFILCKPEIKGDERLHESIKRAQSTYGLSLCTCIASAFHRLWITQRRPAKIFIQSSTIEMTSYTVMLILNMSSMRSFTLTEPYHCSLSGGIFTSDVLHHNCRALIMISPQRKWAKCTRSLSKWSSA